MADQKLTARDALTSPADGDLLYIHDISDTTDDAGGTSKKITRTNYLKTNLAAFDGKTAPSLEILGV